MKKCHRCGKSFEGNGKFCHDKCRDEHILDVEKQVKEAVKDDPNHTQKFSKDF